MSGLVHLVDVNLVGLSLIYIIINIPIPFKFHIGLRGFRGSQKGARMFLVS